MLSLKRICILSMVALSCVSAVVAQSSSRELSIEESYLKESIELMVIRETSHADSREQKLVALQYIGAAIDRGNTSDDIRRALEYLSMEGVVNKTRENGRLLNSYPDIRQQAVKYLGKIGTPEAKSALIKTCAADNEPMVLQEAVKSLGEINSTDNRDTIDAIYWTWKKFDVLNPDNLLALAVVDTIEKIAKRDEGIDNRDVVQMLLKIADAPYIKPVQERARQVLNSLNKYNVRAHEGQQNETASQDQGRKKK